MLSYQSIAEIVELAGEKKQSISSLVLEETAKEQECTQQHLLDVMHERWQVMKEAAQKGVSPDLRSVSGLSGGMAHSMQKHVNSGKSLCTGIAGEALIHSLAVSEVNACMGRIVAAPTAGSCGILPGCLISLQNRYAYSDEVIAKSLFCASAIGMVIATNASVAGAEGGCQAECGSAAAMAAATLVELQGGTPEMSAHACAQALKSLMGLVCDPVAGLVEEPCVIRNASSSAIALVAADLALAGIPSIIPADEVIDAMASVGRQMPQCLRETAEGGIAATPTARSIEARLFETL